MMLCDATIADNISPRPAAQPAAEVEISDAELLARYPRPTVRHECLPGGSNAARPCPYVSCRHHLYIAGIAADGQLRLTFPDRDAVDIPETCALDVAALGEQTFQTVGDLMNLSRERIRQIESDALSRMKPRTLRRLKEAP